MSKGPTRRQLLHRSLLAAGAGGLTACTAAPNPRAARPQATPARGPFNFCLNTSTIRQQAKTLTEQIDIAIEAGYDAIEPWVRHIEAHRDSGGSLKDVARKCADHNLKVASAIGFARWIVDDAAERARGLEQARREMDLVRQIGGTHIAAPPVGAHRGKGPKINLFAVAERYGALCKVGREAGVIPQVEVWGFSRNLSRLGEAIFVAAESAHPDACVLPDIYHVYKGGSDPAAYRMLSAEAVHCFHVNDYPADPPRDKISDADRVFCGDGVAP
ncbi:MAG: sugar phosphate isomerase/epimerase family protein, partial [Phycisphaeraceae bacterium]|nr:sugar phosphate isomerase/epimerase family protein [Phycisphaeraceae bacterium]